MIVNVFTGRRAFFHNAKVEVPEKWRSEALSKTARQCGVCFPLYEYLELLYTLRLPPCDRCNTQRTGKCKNNIFLPSVRTNDIPQYHEQQSAASLRNVTGRREHI
jgi:hypothetical protein